MATAPLIQDWESYSQKNPELESIIAAIGKLKLLTPETTLESLRNYGSDRPPSDLWPSVHEKDIQIPVRDGTSNLARVYSPASSTESEGKPLLVLAYGGGYVMGNVKSEEKHCRNWATQYGGVAIAISYRHAPEHAWPGPQHDITDAVKWIAANYKSVDADPSKGFIIGGTSAGATASITVTHQFRDEGITPPITGLYIAVPGLCRVFDLPDQYKEREKSWEQNKDAPMFDVSVSNFLGKFVNAPPGDELRSPLLFKTGHANLPPTYFVIGGADPWRDTGLIYEEVLRENGISTKIDVYPGLPHAFWGMFPTAKFAAEFWDRSAEGLGWLLEAGRKVSGGSGV